MKVMRNSPADECNQFIIEALEMARQMIILADDGEAAAQDDSCRVLYGIIRDSAYHIRQLAEKEKENHKKRDIWTDGAA